MTKTPYARRGERYKRQYPARISKSSSKPTTPFVVYVTFHSGGKEYVYLCNLPDIDVGSQVVANGTVVTVHRVAAFDTLATKYVQSAQQAQNEQRKKLIRDRLLTIERELAILDRWKSLAKRSPEARKLLKELESL